MSNEMIHFEMECEYFNLQLSEYMTNYVMESGGSSTTNKNIIDKIRDTIKKIFQAMKDAILKIRDKIKSMFSKNANSSKCSDMLGKMMSGLPDYILNSQIDFPDISAFHKVNADELKALPVMKKLLEQKDREDKDGTYESFELMIKKMNKDYKEKVKSSLKNKKMKFSDAVQSVRTALSFQDDMKFDQPFYDKNSTERGYKWNWCGNCDSLTSIAIHEAEIRVNIAREKEEAVKQAKNLVMIGRKIEHKHWKNIPTPLRNPFGTGSWEDAAGEAVAGILFAIPEIIFSSI